MQLKKFKIIILFLCLASCGTKPLTKQLATQTKTQIKELQSQVKNSSCKTNEKEIFYKKLDKIENNINLITNSCEMEKSLLKEQVAKLKLLLLSVAGGLLIIVIMKGKILCTK